MLCLDCRCICFRCQREFVFCNVGWCGVMCSSVVGGLGVVPFVCIVRHVV